MKNSKLKSINSGLIALFFAVVFIACESSPEVTPQADILPEHFGIDIPSSLSNNTLPGGRVSSGRVANGRASGVAAVEGSEIYEHLGLFIHVGESAADIVGEIIEEIRHHHIDKAMSITYESDEDQRVKNVVIVEGAEYEGQPYEFVLTVTDAESEGNVDGGKALQIFWNRSPIKGVALIKPYNIDRLHDADAGEAVFRIDYNSMGDADYDATMMVSIADLTLEEPEVDVYSMRTLQMFVGKKGDYVDVYGNSNHPNAKFLTEKVGYNWAFVASGSETEDAAVAEVGLPLSTLDAEGRSVLLEEYSIHNVLYNEVKTVWPNASERILEAWLANTEAPGFFDKGGFIQGGEAPAPEFLPLVRRIMRLAPYNPKSIANLEINFN